MLKHLEQRFNHNEPAPAFNESSPPDSSADCAVPTEDDLNHHFFQPPSDDPLLSTHDSIVNNNGLADIFSAENLQPNSEAADVAGNKISISVFIQRVASPSGPQSKKES
ncbi:hypothetical protein Ddye_025624 [Dipteronia dyeriana]|uniref:Basic leucine-zipper C-terminal domain-containing protein n=1 Tax=Dipteronia dyeriana TaxID=168575 RepID=A0AAD9WNE5_9ROSI|nr:hypothetical protein Ddye_025624 [Dipteronia dyeriana]